MVVDILIFNEFIYFLNMLKLLKYVHPNISVSYEEKDIDCSKFLDVELMRRMNGNKNAPSAGILRGTTSIRFSQLLCQMHTKVA